MILQNDFISYHKSNKKVKGTFVCGITLVTIRSGVIVQQV